VIEHESCGGVTLLSMPSESLAGAQNGPLFPIVGIGASAGGLAATTELVRELRPHPGVGIVIVHHLDPTHESSLVELFSRATSLTVHAASDGELVEVNHIYVVPPNAGLLIADGRLQLTPRVEAGGMHLPINRFFESLAEDHKAWAVGVLLSGSGSDGSLGIQAIKAAGGITFAQDASAEYPSMPESAVATGCVDLVLPPKALAVELARIGEHPPGAAAHAVPNEREGEAFQQLLTILRTASGIDFANYKHATIRRRAQRRVFLHRLLDLNDYVKLLERDEAEVTALVEEVLIHVTGFFRDPATFEAIETKVFPRLIENRTRRTAIRIWVPGCSTGEEVYSLAISLLECLAAANAADIPIKLFGTDVSMSAIDRARAGKYAEGIEQEISPARLATFFTKVGSCYQIRKDVRDACVFARHDATRDPPFSGMDLVSCRNLMIYLGSALQARTLSIFNYALREPGFLVLGSSETTHSFPGFSVFDAKNKIFQRTPAPRLLFDFTSPEHSEVGLRAAGADSKASGPLDVQREADRLVLAKFAPPGMVVTDDLAIVQFRGRTAPYLEPAPGAPSFDLLRMVREELRLPLRRMIDEVRTKQSVVHLDGLRLVGEEGVRLVEIDVVPMFVAPTEQRFFVVLFRDVTRVLAKPSPEKELPLSGSAAGEPRVVGELREQLASTREYLESVIEQLEASNEELKAANEEITSSNEELRSTNEELQMAKEEIQASNEELRTINEEMAVRAADATRVSDDLTNVLSSAEIPIVLVGRDSRIRRFAPAATRVLELAPSDVGRPLGDITRRLASASAEMAAEVLAHLRPVERTLQDEGGHWYQLSARPYLTLDNRIDGTVLAAFDIDAARKATERLAKAESERARTALEQSKSEFQEVLSTTQRESERRILDYQEKLRQMAFDASLAEERERRRIAADLHDRIGQALMLAQMKLQSLNPAGGRPIAVDEALDLLAQSIVDTRTLVFDLSPPILYELGLEPALSWLAEDLGKRSGVSIEISDDGVTKPLDDGTAGVVFRAVRELLTNVLKHAQTAHAKVSLRRASDQLEIDVEDQGAGFDAEAVRNPATHGFGLFGVREQISRLGGTMDLRSQPQQGTCVSLRIPLKLDETAPKQVAHAAPPRIDPLPRLPMRPT
jgi:two-component system CheB/CheR fusion protein